MNQLMNAVQGLNTYRSPYMLPVSYTHLTLPTKA